MDIHTNDLVNNLSISRRVTSPGGYRRDEITIDKTGCFYPKISQTTLKQSTEKTALTVTKHRIPK